MEKSGGMAEKVSIFLILVAVALGIASVALNIVILTKKTTSNTTIIYEPNTPAPHPEYPSSHQPMPTSKYAPTQGQNSHQNSMVSTTQYTPPAQQCYQVSTDPKFKEAADLLLSSIDFSYDPCEDFYMFSCGKFVNQTKLKPGQLYNATAENARAVNFRVVANIVDNLPENASKTEKVFKWLYESCYEYYDQSNADMSKTIYEEMMKPFGGFPITDSGWTPINKTLLWRMIGKFEASYQVPSVFQSQSTVDYKNQRQYSLFISQASLPNPRDFYVKPQFLKELDDYLESVKELFLLFNKNIGGNLTDEHIAYINQSAIDLVLFEIDLALATVPDDLLRNYKQQYNPYSYADLKTSYPNVEWDVYFGELFSGVNISLDSKTFVLPQPTFVRDMNDMLAQYPMKTLVNFVMKTLLQANTDFIGTQCDKETIQRVKRQSFRRKDFTSDDDALQKCMLSIMLNMPYGMGYTYVKYNPDKWEMQRDAKTMAYYVIDAFHEMTQTLPWMSTEGHEKIKEKIQNLQVNVGWPYWFYEFLPSDEASYIDPYHVNYMGIQKLNKTDYFHVYQALMGAFQKTENFGMMIKNTDRRYFWMSPTLFDSWYNPFVNSITFPLGVLVPPYYKYGFPQAFNFGGQGANAGHELTHGYDDEGIQFGPTGALSGCEWNRCSLIDKNSSFGFLDMAQCVVNQYSTQCCPVKTGSVHCANGVNTQGENIADIGGVQAAYKAYRKYVDEKLGGVEEPRLPGLEDFTPNQIFWMTYGYGWCWKPTDEFLLNMMLTNVHAPFTCRVNNALQDVPEFGRDFQCKKGKTYLYPEDQGRCKVWRGI